MNLLLCTDVIVDFLGQRKPYYDDAERLISFGFFRDAKLWMPAQSFEDVFDELFRLADAEAVEASISKLLEVVNPVDLTSADVAAATRMGWGSFGDCLVAQSASKAGADFLVTHEVERFDRSPVPAISPADLLAKIDGTSSAGSLAVETVIEPAPSEPQDEKPKKKKKDKAEKRSKKQKK